MIVKYKTSDSTTNMENTPVSNTCITKKNECPICFVPIETTGHVTTKCGHRFCLKCLLQHLNNNNNCPLCRTNIQEPSEMPPPINPFQSQQTNTETHSTTQTSMFMRWSMDGVGLQNTINNQPTMNRTLSISERRDFLFLGAKICINPNRYQSARKLLHISLNGEDDNKLATITKIMTVNMDVRLDYSNKVVRFRKDSPYYTLA